MPSPPTPRPDWDLYWTWELLHRKEEPLDFMRWKGDSSRELRGLPEGTDRGGRPPLILDSSCGLGYHAMVQHNLGFQVEGCDGSETALRAARELMAEEGIEIPTFAATWEELGAARPERYDLVWNDELHQVRRPADLLAVLSGIRGALRPGGSLVFFFADAGKPDDGVNQADWEWDNVFEDRVAWTLTRGELEVTLHVMPERRAPDLICEHYVYLMAEKGRPLRTESLTMSRNYRWDWKHVVPVLEEAGFDQVVSHRFDNVHGNTYSMNLARRAAAPGG